MTAAFDADAPAKAVAALWSMFYDWDELSAAQQDHCRRMAHAAIEAYVEPEALEPFVNDGGAT